jgi:hypothetical protein
MRICRGILYSVYAKERRETGIRKCRYQEAEKTNGRWAMMATAGICGQELLGVTPKWFEAGAKEYDLPFLPLLATEFAIMGFLETKRYQGFKETGSVRSQLHHHIHCSNTTQNVVFGKELPPDVGIVPFFTASTSVLCTLPTEQPASCLYYLLECTDTVHNCCVHQSPLHLQSAAVGCHIQSAVGAVIMDASPSQKQVVFLDSVLVCRYHNIRCARSIECICACAWIEC